MGIELTPAVQKRIEEHLDGGPYQTADELVSEALDLLDAQKEAVGRELQRRYDEMASGAVEPLPGSEVMERLRRRIERFRASN